MMEVKADDDQRYVLVLGYKDSWGSLDVSRWQKTVVAYPKRLKYKNKKENIEWKKNHRN